jgi:restriction endonuclease S subunit
MAAYSIIPKSQLEGGLRLDAEYYQPEYLDISEKLKTAQKVADLISDIRYGLYVEPEYKREGVDFIRALNLVNLWIDGDILKIDESKVPESYRLKTADSLIVRSGANTGSVALVDSRFNSATFGSYTIRLRFNKINPFFAAVFLNTRYGVLQTQRLQTGMAQPNLNIPNIKEIRIPLASEEKQREIEKLCGKIEEEREKSESFYSQAEDLLLEELGLKGFSFDEDLYNIVNLSDVKTAGRMDAEHFQLMYGNLELRIRNYGAKELENFIKDYSTGFPFKSDNYQEEGVPLIRINNIKKGYLDLSDTAFLAKKDHLLSLKDIAKSGDIILSMSGTIGMSATVPNDMPKSSVNQRILKFTPKNIDKDYLVLLLNSVIGSYQLEKIGTGGVQTNISYKDIKNILIPILPQSTQQKIADLVRRSHKARYEAKRLLEEAKQKVEDLIEKDKI